MEVNRRHPRWQSLKREIILRSGKTFISSHFFILSFKISVSGMFLICIIIISIYNLEMNIYICIFKMNMQKYILQVIC